MASSIPPGFPPHLLPHFEAMGKVKSAFLDKATDDVTAGPPLDGCRAEEFSVAVSELLKLANGRYLPGLTSWAIMNIFERFPKNGVAPSFSETTTAANLATLIKATFTRPDQPSQDGAAVILALEGLHAVPIKGGMRCFPGKPPRAHGKVLEIFAWYVKEFLPVRCGLLKPWRRPDSDSWRFQQGSVPYRSPLSAAIAFGEKDVFEMLLACETGFDVEELLGTPGNTPLSTAFRCGDLHFAERLLSLGVRSSNRCERFGPQAAVMRGNYRWPVVFELLRMSGMTDIRKEGSPASAELKSLRLAIILRCVELEPAIVPDLTMLATSNVGDSYEYGFLHLAIESDNSELIQLAFEHGGKFITSTKSSLSDGARQATMLTTFVTATSPSVSDGTFEFLLSRGLLDDWRSRYPEDEQEQGAMAIQKLASKVASLLDKPEGKAAWKRLETILAAGFNRLHDFEGQNILVESFCFQGEFGQPIEEHFVKVLQLLHAHGCDLYNCDTSLIYGGARLPMYGAALDMTSVIDFGLSIPGVGIDDVCTFVNPSRPSVPPMKATAISLALDQSRCIAIRHLFNKGARMVIDGFAAEEQPISRLITLKLDGFVFEMLPQALSKQPECLASKYFLPSSKGELMHPLHLAISFDAPARLELILTGNNPYLGEAVDFLNRFPKSGKIELATAAQMAAHLHRWKFLVPFLKHTKTPVTKEGIAVLVKASGFGPRYVPAPSIAESVEKHCKDRAIRALVQAKAKKERKELASGGGSSSTGIAASGLPSNAFEDPRTKVLTEREEKAKAKKREQKKKAKAKKKAAAAAAGAGAGVDEPAEDSDSSGTDQEEKGLDEKERMLARAPAFDLEKERAARKAAKEKEEKERQEAKE
jgi:hypothetical protein